MDVVTAISQQNLQVAAGQIGQPPALKAQQFQLTINTLGRLIDPQQFADIIVKTAEGRPQPTQGAGSILAGANPTTSTSTGGTPSASTLTMTTVRCRRPPASSN